MGISQFRTRTLFAPPVGYARVGGDSRSVTFKPAAVQGWCQKRQREADRAPPGADHPASGTVGHGKAAFGPDAETLLFAAARNDHVRTVILPALNQGIWVLCDRFYNSTRAYQGRLGQVSPGVLNAMQRVTIGVLEPDLTVILDLPVESDRSAPLPGAAASTDRFEAET